MVKSRFSTNLHILTLLAMYTDGWKTSSRISASLNINPVLVRQELRTLKNAGLLESKEGKNGGVRLAKNASDILLSDIFMAIKEDDHIFSLRTESPSQACRVGSQINHNLTVLFEELDQKVKETLDHLSLEEFKDRF